MNSRHEIQWRGALTFSLICTWTNSGVNNQDAVDFWRNRAHYDDAVMCASIAHRRSLDGFNKEMQTYSNEPN